MDVTRRSALQSLLGIPAMVSSGVPSTRAQVGSWDSNRLVSSSLSRIVAEVEFPSEGAVLRGLLYMPEEQGGRLPVIIMAHGTSATVRMVADMYAEYFSESGFAVLLYDHRNLGRSGGEPRQEINPWVQCRGYRDAISYVETLDVVDPNRVAIWGDSYSAGGVMVVGALDERVKVIIAQCPACGAELPSHELSDANFQAIRSTLLTGDVSGSPETTVGPMPVVSSDQMGSPSLLEPIQAFRWFIDYGGRHGTYWVNEVTRVVPAVPVPYSPVLCAPYVQAPILMMAAPDDEMELANYSVARFAYEAMPNPKEWYDIRGGHFGLLYYPGEVFDEATQVQGDFLRKWL